MKEIYVLKTDSDGTLRSRDEDFGVGVTSKEEAERFVKDGGVGYSHSYSKLTIFDDKDKAINYAFSKEKNTDSIEKIVVDQDKIVKDIIELIEFFGYMDTNHLNKYLKSLELRDKGIGEPNEFENGNGMAYGECKSLLVKKFQYLLPDNYRLANELDSDIDRCKNSLIEFLKGKKYILVDEHSTEMTEEYEKEHAWELSRNIFINSIITEIEQMKN